MGPIQEIEVARRVDENWWKPWRWWWIDLRVKFVQSLRYLEWCLIKILSLCQRFSFFQVQSS